MSEANALRSKNALLFFFIKPCYNYLVMKIILSRKGTDSASGGIPGIFIREEKKIVSFPIPLPDDIRYSDLSYDGKTYAEIIKELDSTFQYDNCHLDPDLLSDVKRRGKWQAAFGQEGAPAKHLDNQGVKEGDIFLFFGWFREAIEEDGKYHFMPGKPDLHMIYGYLQVGKILREQREMQDELPDHPHSKYDADAPKHRNNRIYVAKEYLFDDPTCPGAGVFPFSDELILTKEKEPRSHWKKFLPKNEYDVTYHNNRKEESKYFPCVSRGQEFVITSHSNESDPKKKELTEKQSKKIKQWIIKRIKNEDNG